MMSLLLPMIISTVGAVGAVSMQGPTNNFAIFGIAFLGSYVLQTALIGLNSITRGAKFYWPGVMLSLVAGVGMIVSRDLFQNQNEYLVVGIIEMIYLLASSGTGMMPMDNVTPVY